MKKNFFKKKIPKFKNWKIKNWKMSKLAKNWQQQQHENNMTTQWQQTWQKLSKKFVAGFLFIFDFSFWSKGRGPPLPRPASLSSFPSRAALGRTAFSDRERAPALAALHAHMIALFLLWLWPSSPLQNNTRPVSSLRRQAATKSCDPLWPRPTFVANQKKTNEKKKQKTMKNKPCPPRCVGAGFTMCEQKKKDLHRKRVWPPDIVRFGPVDAFPAPFSPSKKFSLFFSRFSGSSPSSGPPKKFFFSRPFSLFFPYRGVFWWNCGHGSRPWTTQIVRLGFSGVILWTPSATSTVKSQFGWCMTATRGHSSTRGPVEREKKRERKWGLQRGKKRKFGLPPPLRAPLFLVWPPFRAPTLQGPLPIGPSGPQPQLSLSIAPFIFVFFFLLLCFLFFTVGSILLAKVGLAEVGRSQKSRKNPEIRHRRWHTSHVRNHRASRPRRRFLTMMRRTRPPATVSSQRLSRALGWVRNKRTRASKRECHAVGTHVKGSPAIGPPWEPTPWTAETNVATWRESPHLSLPTARMRQGNKQGWWKR